MGYYCDLGCSPGMENPALSVAGFAPVMAQINVKALRRIGAFGAFQKRLILLAFDRRMTPKNTRREVDAEDSFMIWIGEEVGSVLSLTS